MITVNTATDERIAILLQVLGTDAAELVLEQMSPQQANAMKSNLAELAQSPPTEEEVDEVLEEFHRVLQFALVDRRSGQSAPGDSSAASQDQDAEEQTPPEFVPSDDPFDDLLRLESFQIAGALRDESVATIAVVLGCLPAERAGDVIQQLPELMRREVFLKINAPPKTPASLLAQIVRATVDKGCRLDRKAASDPNRVADEKLARVLRSMDRTNRQVMLQTLEEADPEKAQRIKDMFYVFTDLERVSDRSIQRLLGEVDSATLATALKNADETLVDRITHNLSKRARATLLEEIEFMGSVSAEQQAGAEKAICDVMSRLDNAGDLEMTE